MPTLRWFVVFCALLVPVVAAQPQPETPPKPPLPVSTVSTDQYIYLTAQYSYLTALLQQLVDARQRQDLAFAAITSRLQEIETRIASKVEDESTGNLAKVTTFSAAAAGAILAGVQSFKNAPRCQP